MSVKASTKDALKLIKYGVPLSEFSVSTLIKLANSPLSSTEILDKLSKYRIESIEEALLTNPSAKSELHKKLIAKADPRVLANKMTFETPTPAAITEYVNVAIMNLKGESGKMESNDFFNYWRILESAAYNTATVPELLSELFSFTNKWHDNGGKATGFNYQVMVRIMINPNTPNNLFINNLSWFLRQSTGFFLSQHMSASQIEAVLAYASESDENLQQLGLHLADLATKRNATGKLQEAVVDALIRWDSLPLSDRERNYLKNISWSTRSTEQLMKIASHPATTGNTLEKIFHSVLKQGNTAGSLVEIIAKHKNLRLDILQEILTEKNGCSQKAQNFARGHRRYIHFLEQGK